MQRPTAAQLQQATERHQQRATGIPPPSPKFRPWRARIDPATFSDFQLPVKVITSAADIEPWLESEACHRLMAFVLAVNEACKNRRVRDVPATEASRVDLRSDRRRTVLSWAFRTRAFDLISHEIVYIKR